MSNNSSNISDIDDNASVSDACNYDTKQSQEIDEKAEQNYIQTVVLDKVIKYVKLDDVIKKKQQEHKKELKAIKETKEKIELFLINYLDKINEEYIQLGGASTLIKTEVKTKTALKIEDIALCLNEGFKKHNIGSDDVAVKAIIDDFIGSIESKRATKTRKYLKRTNGKKPGKVK